MSSKLRLPEFKLLRHLQRNFIAGLIVVTPVAATILIIKWLFDAIDGILEPVFEFIFNDYVPGIGFAAMIILIYLSGVLAANILGRKLALYAESMIKKIPVVSYIYNTSRQIIDSLIMSQKGAFKEVVLVEFPKDGMKSIGFVTSKTTDSAGMELLSIFIPTAPNPTSGFLEILPPESVIKTDISVEDAMKIVLSAGMVTPSSIEMYPYQQGAV